MNRELQATFDLDAFAHEAFYNSLEGRIEIYFRSLRPQTGRRRRPHLQLRGRRAVHTEYSYKFDVAGIEAMARSAGMRIAETWTDPSRLFAVTYLVTAPERSVPALEFPRERGIRPSGEGGIAERGGGGDAK